MRFEDLCAEPGLTVGAILAFFGLEGDVEAAAAQVRPPDSLGRWQRRRSRLVEELTEVAEPALERFGYA